LYIKSKQKVKLSIGLLERNDGSSDAGVANDLNRFFESTFTQEDLSDVPVLHLDLNKLIVMLKR